jgi:hypothetical protein
MQDFSFHWTRTTPFGLVFFLEAPGHHNSPYKEFAVVLNSPSSSKLGADAGTKQSRAGTNG